MNIEIKKSVKPVDYDKALKYMERRLDDLINNKAKELLWILEHKEIYTAGTSSKNREILNKSINVI